MKYIIGYNEGFIGDSIRKLRYDDERTAIGIYNKITDDLEVREISSSRLTVAYCVTIDGFDIVAKLKRFGDKLEVDGVELECSSNIASKIFNKLDQVKNKEKTEMDNFIRKDARLNFDRKSNEGESYIDFDTEDIEDLFLEYIDKWNMKDEFSKHIIIIGGQEKILYHIKKEKNSEYCFRLMVTCRKELSKVDKSELVHDMKSFISRLNKMGFEVKWNNKHNPANFIDGFNSYGGQYTNRLGIYINK